ncbi:Methionine import ATP-binding protein MetN [uncultured Eubacterium sp.]|nr:Methionine import ATP-binding protein MetN [uncultured Eubacterium sp.]
MGIIELKGVTKAFKKSRVLEDISLDLREGKIYGFVGRNGTGKSVLFKLICGLMIPSSGEITVNGKILKNGGFAEDIGILLDNTGFMPRMSAFDNLKSIAVINNVISDERIKECIQIVGLDANADKHVSKYSLGMKQRLGIAQAIMESPKILLLDEPMNGLDEQGVKDMRILLKEYQKEHGATILIASHDKEDIAELCDVVYSISGGKIRLRDVSQNLSNHNC